MLCLKPIYGLNDAPLACQLSLHSFLLELGAHRSKLDENCFYWKQPNKGKVDIFNNLDAMVMTHVDDLAIMAEESWLDLHYSEFVQKFQKVTRQQLPFQHCGCEYAETNQGFSITQKDFAEKLTHAKVPSRAEESKLLPDEVTEFRIRVGGIVVGDIYQIGCGVGCIAATGSSHSSRNSRHQMANSVVDKVKAYSDVGLHYRFFGSDHQRVVCVHDASSASKGRHYAQEGILVMLAVDHWRGHQIDHEHICDDYTVAKHDVLMHVLHSQAPRLKG